MDLTDHLSRRGIRLDDEQLQAVRHERGPLLVIAVPGSGKTTVLVSRIARMMALGAARRENILTLTFNRAAAEDMRRRFGDLFGDAFDRAPHFSTLHALCYLIIKNAGRPLPQIDERGRMALIRDILRHLSGRFNRVVPEEDILNAANALSYTKNRLLPPQEYEGHGLSVSFPQFCALYREAMAQRGWMDFDDMLLEALSLLEDSRVRERWQRQYTHILVDEAQDLSLVQHRIIRYLAEKAQSLFMVGDEDQSIYSFRGAHPQALLAFSQTYPGGRILRMQTNYRSLPQIVEKADAFIRRNTDRYPKHMVASRSGSARILTHAFSDKRAQCRYVVDAIAALAPEQTAAVLYRSHLSSVPLADGFLRRGMAFGCRESGKFFFTHPVTQDLRSFLELALDPSRRDLFENIYYKFNAFLSREHLSRVLAAPAEKTVWQALETADDWPAYRLDRLRRKAGLFAQLVSLPPAQAMDRLFYEGEYQLYLAQSPALSVASTAALAQWDALRSIAENLDTVTGFLDRLDFLESSLPDWEKLAQPGAPVLSTVHGAKGLEFDHVFVVDLVEHQFPAAGADGQEEARLFYVAVTRARQNLHLSYTLPGPASCFLARLIPPEKAVSPAHRRSRPPIPKRKTQPPADFSAFPPGQGVRHVRWGPGIVEAIDPPSGRIVVRFASGERTLSLARCLADGLLAPDEGFAP
jgi:DNA helicase-2/ATP-dependent DNA helicase PcrA